MRIEWARPRIVGSRHGSDADAPPPSGRSGFVSRWSTGRSVAAVAYPARPRARRSLPSPRRRPPPRNRATRQNPSTDRRELRAAQPSREPASVRYAVAPSDSTRPIGCRRACTSHIGHQKPKRRPCTHSALVSERPAPASASPKRERMPAATARLHAVGADLASTASAAQTAAVLHQKTARASEFVGSLGNDLHRQLFAG